MSQIQKEYAGDNDAYKRPYLTLMTGIEWYNRFVDEAGKINLKFNRFQSSVGISELVSKEIEAAAKRAAGLTDKESTDV